MVEILEGKNLVHNGGLITAKDGHVKLGAKLEAELIQGGIAKVVRSTEKQQSADSPKDADGDKAQDVKPPEDASEKEGGRERGDKPGYNVDMKADYLRGLMKDFELAIKPGMSKVAMVAALDELFSPQTADSEEPPVLGAEEPVA